jgi:acyl-CoA synthetase (AMP-forming)/AMP-acid ligase II
MNLFDILRQHVATQPNAIASRSSRRVVTYRKFWSRIERATARLMAEWQVKPGDIVVYCGQGHQDALMLYIAVARCGARLLPLEHHEDLAILQEIPAVLLLHDDELNIDLPHAIPVVSNLSSLIASRCHHAPAVTEDIDRTSLLTLAAKENGVQQMSEKNVHQLVKQEVQDATRNFHITSALFDTDIFSPQVLPVLVAGGTVVFR